MSSETRSSGCKNCGGTEWVDEDHITPLLEGKPPIPRGSYPCPFCNALADAKEREQAWTALIGFDPSQRPAKVY